MERAFGWLGIPMRTMFAFVSPRTRLHELQPNLN